MVSRNVSAPWTMPPRNEQFGSRKSAQIPRRSVAYKSAQVATSDHCVKNGSALRTYVYYKIKWR